MHRPMDTDLVAMSLVPEFLNCIDISRDVPNIRFRFRKPNNIRVFWDSVSGSGFGSEIRFNRINFTLDIMAWQWHINI